MGLKRSGLWIIAIFSVFLVAAVVNLHDATAKSEPQKLSGKIELSRTSSPQSGVKLIEDILQRVRNVPQLAMAKQGLRLQKEEFAQDAKKQGPTDYRLAIKPQESAKPNFPALAFAPNSMQSYGNYRGGYGGGSGGANVRGRLISKDKDSSAPARGNIWERDQRQETESSSREVSLPSAPPPSSLAASQSASDNAKGLWEKQNEIVDRLSPESRRRLGSSLNKLAGSLQNFSDAESVVKSATPSINPNKAKLASSNIRQNARQQAQSKEGAPAKPTFYRASRQLDIVDDRPMIKDFREVKPAQAPEQFMPQGADSTVVNGIANPVQSLKAGRLARADEAPGVNEYRVALLPPNVVTGIPVIHLGSSQNQANRALAAIGNMHKYTLNGWTVWTCQRSNSSEPALQVYMRHGQVEALRIFDPALVSPDLGVRLGDGLEAVKEKFGEPAFILSEPLPGNGQNYVYPISQVCFLLSRQEPGAAPQISSLLIFNVK